LKTGKKAGRNNRNLTQQETPAGSGGELLVEGAKAVLETEFPELYKRITLHLPNEKFRRLGQAVAAASLPDLR